MLRLSIACAVLAFVLPQSKTEDEGPSAKVPQLKALEHYVGDWDVEFVSKDLPFAKSKASAKWVLDGRFVEQTGEVVDRNGGVALKLKTLFTFDPKKNAYRSWIFTNDGSVTEADCVWDEKAKTMTSIARKVEGESFTTTTADFSEAGVENWKIVITDEAGKATEIVGKNTKQKKKAQ